MFLVYRVLVVQLVPDGRQFVHHTTLFDTWARALDAAKPARVDAIFLDWSKAFDRVDHSIILQKLHKYGICSNMWMWINNFLSRRKQRVVFSGAKSDWVPVTSGVPQGSVLGPVLFNLFTSELPNYVKSSLPQYADDTVLYIIIRSTNDTVILQNDLDIINKWCTDNQMQLNSNKCKIMHVTRSRSQIPTTYLLQGSHPLKVVDSYKYLGVIFSKRLVLVKTCANGSFKVFKTGWIYPPHSKIQKPTGIT